jgi:hypothetical protein
MSCRILPAVALLFAPVCAQEPENQDPMTEAHAALAPFAGTWNTTCRLGAPGAPPMELTGTERFELVCDGLWLKSVVDSSLMGEPFQGISLLGYDPHAKTYVSLWVDSTSPGATRGVGRFDAATKTWTWKTVSGEGPARITTVWKDDRTIVETGYGPGQDGKEVEVMKITRTRAPAAGAGTARPAGETKGTVGAEPQVARAPVASVVQARGPRQPMHDELGSRLVGRWNAVTRLSVPGMPPSEEEGKEINSGVCNGLWVWSDFEGTMMGQPFEGHALIGYDPASKKVVSFWVDSMSATMSESTGTFDQKTKTLTSIGTTFDPTGQQIATKEISTWKDDHTRSLRMTMGEGERAMKLEIDLQRSMELPDHRIR